VLSLGYVLSLIGKLAQGRNEMGVRRKRKVRGDASYIRTLSSDGRKYIDPDAFIESAKVQDRLERLRKSFDANGHEAEPR
jgi:hypothetical protein